MNFVSIRIITEDVQRLTGFYERATGQQATWGNENFAEIGTAAGTLAIASTRTVPVFAPGAARAADNHSVIIEFLVDDVDAVYEKLTGLVEEFVSQPTTMPWGTGRCCSATPTATWSTSSPRLPPRPSRSSAADVIHRRLNMDRLPYI